MVVGHSGSPWPRREASRGLSAVTAAGLGILSFSLLLSCLSFLGNPEVSTKYPEFHRTIFLSTSALHPLSCPDRTPDQLKTVFPTQSLVYRDHFWLMGNRDPWRDGWFWLGARGASGEPGAARHPRMPESHEMIRVTPAGPGADTKSLPLADMGRSEYPWG